MKTCKEKKRTRKINRSSGNLQQFVVCTVGSDKYGVDVLNVMEINRMVEITRLPDTPYYVEGMVKLGGDEILLIDLRKRLDLEVREHDNSTRIVVVDIGDANIGLVVDSVSEVLRIPASAIESPTDEDTDLNSEFIRGIARLDDCMVTILHLPKVFDLEETTGVTG